MALSFVFGGVELAVSAIWFGAKSAYGVATYIASTQNQQSLNARLDGIERRLDMLLDERNDTKIQQDARVINNEVAEIASEVALLRNEPEVLFDERQDMTSELNHRSAYQQSPSYPRYRRPSSVVNDINNEATTTLLDSEDDSCGEECDIDTAGHMNDSGYAGDNSYLGGYPNYAIPEAVRVPIIYGTPIASPTEYRRTEKD